MKKHKC